MKAIRVCLYLCLMSFCGGGVRAATAATPSLLSERAKLDVNKSVRIASGQAKMAKPLFGHYARAKLCDLALSGMLAVVFDPSRYDKKISGSSTNTYKDLLEGVCNALKLKVGKKKDEVAPLTDLLRKFFDVMNNATMRSKVQRTMEIDKDVSRQVVLDSLLRHINKASGPTVSVDRGQHHDDSVAVAPGTHAEPLNVMQSLSQESSALPAADLAQQYGGGYDDDSNPPLAADSVEQPDGGYDGESHFGLRPPVSYGQLQIAERVYPSACPFHNVDSNKVLTCEKSIAPSTLGVPSTTRKIAQKGAMFMACAAIAALLVDCAVRKKKALLVRGLQAGGRLCSSIGRWFSCRGHSVNTPLSSKNNR